MYTIDYYTALIIKIITHDVYYSIILESDVNVNSVSVESVHQMWNITHHHILSNGTKE